MIDPNTFSPVKVFNRVRLLKDFFLKRSLVSGLPVEIGIEIVNQCNLKCLMCPYQEMVKGKLRPQGEMGFPLFRKIIDEIAPFAELVYLHGMGEPLLHPRLFQFIKYAKHKNLRVGISTNATLLGRDKSKKLLAAGIDYLIFALDGARKKTYEKIRKGAVFEKTQANIDNFLKIKNKGRIKPFVAVQFISLKENEKEAGLFLKKWRRKGVDIARIKPKIDLKKADKRPRPFAKPYCFHIFRQLNIFQDGTVVPCCEDVFGGYPLGNVKKEGVKQIWNNRRMRDLREANFANQASRISLCRTCSYPQPNRLQALGALTFDHLTVKKILPRMERWQNKNLR